MLNTILWRLHAVVAFVALLFFGYKLALLLLDRTEALRSLRARTRWADSLLLGLGLLTFGAASFTYPGPRSAWLWFPVMLTTFILTSFIRALRQEKKWVASFMLFGATVEYATLAHGALFIQWPHQPNLLQQALLGQAPNAAAIAAASPAHTAGQPETTATPDADAPIEATEPPASANLSAADAAAITAATDGASGAEASAAPAEGPPLAAGLALFQQNCVVCHGPDGQRGLNGAHDLTKSNLNTAGRVYLVTNGLGKMPAFQGKLTDEQIRQVVAYSLTLR